MKMPTSRATILPLLLLILISDTRALSPATAPAHPPKHASKRTPVSAPPLPPALPPTSPLPPSPAFTGPDCTTALLNLTSCLSFVVQGANLTVPEKGCCPSLAGLVDSNPICLCQLLSTSNTFGIKIDDTKALMLPTVCHVETPPVSLCSALGIPVASPGALSPSGGGGGAAVPSGSGPLAPATSIAAAPSASGGGASTAIATSLQLALLAIISQQFFISF
ncbi:Xylogen-like protein 11 [Dendrobium catenatum]|uniref:Xylogen-like protein 11 n=2 Tax=Dendrobium catenatum TaxID=906689 RepID=A0A2I0VL17_9ASPA|nr:Xylogen-like protein 11 [Dendrobium catenatum]